MAVINIPAPIREPGIPGAIGQAAMSLVQGWFSGMQRKWESQSLAEDTTDIQDYLNKILIAKAMGQTAPNIPPPQVTTERGQNMLANVMMTLMMPSQKMMELGKEGYTPEQIKSILNVSYGLQPRAGQPKSTTQIESLEKSADQRLQSVLETIPAAMEEIKNPLFPEQPGIMTMRKDYQPIREDAIMLRDAIIDWSNAVSQITGIEPERLQSLGFDVLNRKLPSIKAQFGEKTEGKKWFNIKEPGQEERQGTLQDLLAIGEEWLKPEEPAPEPTPARTMFRPLATFMERTVEKGAGVLEKVLGKPITRETQNNISRSMVAINKLKLTREQKSKIMRSIAKNKHIRVKSPEGVIGYIPANEVADALEQEYMLTVE